MDFAHLLTAVLPSSFLLNPSQSFLNCSPTNPSFLASPSDHLFLAILLSVHPPPQQCLHFPCIPGYVLLACALDYCCLTLPALGGWGWGGTESMTGSGSRWETLQQALIPSTRASLVPRKHRFYSSSWLAHIIHTSNPCSLRQSSIRSSFRRCLCGCVVPSIYIEVATEIPPTFSLFSDFDCLVGARVPLLDIVDPTLEDFQYTGLCLF